jgi:DNA-binding LacI/PurR family transcriptional regulator
LQFIERVLRDAGLAVPEQVALAAFSESGLMVSGSPFPLMVMNHEAIGMHAVEMALKLVEKKGEPLDSVAEPMQFLQGAGVMGPKR